MIDTRYRSGAKEHMDDFDLGGKVVGDALEQIARINRWLGGNHLTVQGVDRILEKMPKDQPVVITDVGCGNGDMLRTLSQHAKKNGFNFKLIGIDANDYTIERAKTLSVDFPDISYFCYDVLKENRIESSDIVLCTLTIHHFKDEEIMRLLALFKEARWGVVINDLHRNIIAYRLFQLVCFVFRLNRMPREDGLTSILRGFKKYELIEFAKKSKFRNYTIRWKWAFRFQWIIFTR